MKHEMKLIFLIALIFLVTAGIVVTHQSKIIKMKPGFPTGVITGPYRGSFDDVGRLKLLEKKLDYLEEKLKLLEAQKNKR